jgi:hypothetical protein
MNNKILVMLTAGLMAAPIAAIAQITTLSYDGDLMAGTSTYLPTGLIVPNGTFATLPTAPVTGEFTASLAVSGSLAANNLKLISFDVTFNGSNGIPGFSPVIDFGPAPLDSFGGPSFCTDAAFGGGCINLTTSNGAITGATWDLVNKGYHRSYSTIDIGPTGDMFTFVYATTDGTCENQAHPPPLSGGNVYTGMSINPCLVRASNKTPGEWLVTTIAAPEIDPAAAASGLLLLFGGVAVLRGRRKTKIAVI